MGQKREIGRKRGGNAYNMEIQGSLWRGARPCEKRMQEICDSNRDRQKGDTKGETETMQFISERTLQDIHRNPDAGERHTSIGT